VKITLDSSVLISAFLTPHGTRQVGPPHDRAGIAAAVSEESLRAVGVGQCLPIALGKRRNVLQRHEAADADDADIGWLRPSGEICRRTVE
jgi:predicted nucleic acid-binding protein